MGETGFLAAAAAFNFSFLMLLVLVPLVAVREGDSLAVIGLLTAVPGLLQFSLSVVAGVLTDLWGARRVLLLCYLASALAAVPLLQPRPGLAALVIALLLNGVARGAFWPSALTYATQMSAETARSLSRMYTLTGIGAIVALAVAGSLAAHVGFPLAFAVSGLAGLAAVALTWRLPPTVPRPGRRGAHHALAPLRGLMRQRALLVAGALAFAASVPFALAGSFYPVFALQLGFGAALATALVALRQGGMIAGASLFAPLLRRLGIRATVIAGLGAIALSLAAAPLLRAPALFAAGLALSGIAGEVVSVAYVWFITQNSRPEERGSAMGATELWWAAAVLVTPAIFGGVAARLGVAATFALAGGAMAALGGSFAVRPGWLQPGRAPAAAAGEN